MSMCLSVREKVFLVTLSFAVSHTLRQPSLGKLLKYISGCLQRVAWRWLQQEGNQPADQLRLCTFSLCLRGFPLGAQVFSHSPKTYRLGQLTTQTCPCV